ncbi:MAG TPA: hypothetical protein VKD67_13535, partial [Acidimicrobiales bacterium]|nr:hypothetical protein [Acidimicrobiales bacterium]
MRRLPLLAFALLALSSCFSTEPLKEWYKPGPYTTAEFQRDQKECTRNGVVDESCLTAKGWIGVT